jgi:hypothetical protein
VLTPLQALHKLWGRLLKHRGYETSHASCQNCNNPEKVSTALIPEISVCDKRYRMNQMSHIAREQSSPSRLKKFSKTVN